MFAVLWGVIIDQTEMESRILPYQEFCQTKEIAQKPSPLIGDRCG